MDTLLTQSETLHVTEVQEFSSSGMLFLRFKVSNDRYDLCHSRTPTVSQWY